MTTSSTYRVRFRFRQGEMAFISARSWRFLDLLDDAQGRRRCRKTDAQNVTQARQIRSAELLRVERTKALGFSPPGQETFAQGPTRFLKYQKARLTRKAFERENGIVEKHLKPFFKCS